ncbi:hypothetical protein ACS0TY_020145 [Phlomoides rotata]
MWAIWMSRNSLIFYGRSLNFDDVKRNAATQLVDFAEVGADGGWARFAQVAARWTPPSACSLKINTDASIRPGVGAAVAGVVWDGDGRVCWCFAERCQVEMDVDVAEAWAILRGIMHVGFSIGTAEIDFD